MPSFEVIKIDEEKIRVIETEVHPNGSKQTNEQTVNKEAFVFALLREKENIMQQQNVLQIKQAQLQELIDAVFKTT